MYFLLLELVEIGVFLLAEYILQNWSDGTAHFLACSLAILLQVPNI